MSRRQLKLMSLGRMRRFGVNKSRSDVDAALQFVVRSAYASIPAYRPLLEAAGISPCDIRNVQDLPRLPIVRREDLFLDSPLVARIHRRADPSKCVRTLTSGTQGIPVSIYMSHGEAFFRKLLLLRAWRQGTRLRFPLTVIDLGTPVDSGAEVEVRWHGLVRLVRVSVASPDDADIDAMARFRGAVLSGFPSNLSLLAERVARGSSRLSLRLVATRGEILHDAVRDELRKGFGCPVMDFYNCEEVGSIAWQCPVDYRVMHVNADGCVVEVVNELGMPQPPGASGRILVTSLYNCTMPFIRYDLQDRGAFVSTSGERCACGSRRPTMQVVEGRDDDHVLRTDGHRMSPRFVAAAMERSIDALRAHMPYDTFYRGYQIVQDRADHVAVRVIPVPQVVGARVEDLILGAFQRLDPSMRCDVVFVDDLPVEPSGKFRKVMRTFVPPEA